jgi:hypothetical protein
MNGTVSRRVFVGSLAGAGVGAVGTTSLLDFPVSAQRAATDPLVHEIRRQLKQAFGKMQNGQSGGARQAATVLRLYASTVNESELRAALRKANRGQLLSREMNHGEMVRQAQELGLDPARLPPHRLIPYAERGEAVAQLLRDGLGASMRAAADLVDDVAEKIEALPREQRGAFVQTIALQPIPEPVDCGNCDAVAQAVDYAEKQMGIACALAGLFPLPPVVAACQAAIASFLVILGAFASCRAIVALCEHYYN